MTNSIVAALAELVASALEGLHRIQTPPDSADLELYSDEDLTADALRQPS